MKKLVFVFLVSLLVFTALPALACHSCDYTPPERPDWWDNADAKVIFCPVPSMGTSGGGTAAGTKGYEYSWMTQSIFDSDYLSVLLQNQENQSMTKLFWVAVHFSDWNNDLGDCEAPIITGYYRDGSSESISPEYGDGTVWVNGDWAFWESELFPQPDRETFTINVAGEEFEIDYVENGTYCVPIPSTLFLLGGGLVGLFGIRRRIRRG